MRNLILSHHFSASCRNFLAQAGIQAYQYGAELLETTSLGMSERGRSLHPHLVNVLSVSYTHLTLPTIRLV